MDNCKKHVLQPDRYNCLCKIWPTCLLFAGIKIKNKARAYINARVLKKKPHKWRLDGHTALKANIHTKHAKQKKPIPSEKKFNKTTARTSHFQLYTNTNKVLKMQCVL